MSSIETHPLHPIHGAGFAGGASVQRPSGISQQDDAVYQRLFIDSNSYSSDIEGFRTSSPAPNDIHRSPTFLQKTGLKRVGGYARHQWRRFRTTLTSTWAWEVGGICLSIICMLAIIFTVPNVNGRPLSDWKFFLSPNTMVSTFTTISKTSMLLVVAEGISQLKWSYFQSDAHPLAELQHFDAASRGPWGALAFLLRAKRRAIIASLGALITIAALAMDPFGQQIVSFETRSVPHDDSRVAIPAAYVYDHLNGPWIDAWELSGAVLGGVFKAVPSVPATCPSGHCKWPTFSTLGICSSCTNVTEKTAISSCVTEFHRDYYDAVSGKSLEYLCVTNMTRNETKTSNCTNWPTFPNQTSSVVFVNSTYDIPYNTSFVDSILYGIQGNLSSETRKRVAAAGYGVSRGIVHRSEIIPGETTKSRNGASGFTNMSNLVFTTAKVSNDGFQEFELGACPTRVTEVMQCHVRWCLQSFDGVEMINGTMMSYKEREGGVAFDEKEVDSPEQPRILSLYPINNNSSPLPQQPSIMKVDITSVYDFSKLVLGLFPVNSSNVYYDGYQFDMRGALALDKNVSEIMERVAKSLTNLVRTGPNTTDAHGIAYSSEVFVVIRWQWLLLPGMLVFLSAVFFALTMWLSRKSRGSPLWKSKVLPFLFHGLDGWREGELKVLDEGGMYKAARRMKAQLLKNEEGDRKFVRAYN